MANSWTSFTNCLSILNTRRTLSCWPKCLQLANHACAWAGTTDRPCNPHTIPNESIPTSTSSQPCPCPMVRASSNSMSSVIKALSATISWVMNNYKQRSSPLYGSEPPLVLLVISFVSMHHPWLLIRVMVGFPRYMTKERDMGPH